MHDDAGLVARPLESAHFGLPVFAAVVKTVVDANNVIATMRARQVGLTVIRTPAGATAAIHALERQGALLCDVLLTLSTTVSAGVADSGRQASVVIRTGTLGDAAAVARIADTAFTGFVGHWHADDRLPSQAADMLYARWSADLTRIADGDGHPLLIAERDHVPVGFLALARDDDANWSVPLTAVERTVRRTGAFRALLDGARSIVSRAGGGRLDYETQLTNHAALGAVAGAGFVPTTARLTFHFWAGTA